MKEIDLLLGAVLIEEKTRNGIRSMLSGCIYSGAERSELIWTAGPQRFPVGIAG